nr:AAA family ATPase [Armatimonadota bacterium]
ANRMELELVEATRSLQVMQQSLAESEKRVSESRTGRERVIARLEALSEGTRTANRLQQECARTIFTMESARTAIENEMERIRLVLAEDYGVPIPAEPQAVVDGDATGAAGDGTEGAMDVDNPEQEHDVASGTDIVFDATIGHSPYPAPDPVAVFLQEVTPSLNPERDQQQATRLRRQMRALEPVNLEAIEEAAAVSERLDFLKGQRADIESAVHDLEEVIQKIDAEARERFMATFTEIALHFDDLFRQLFGGGQTRLSLTDSSDPTGAGIEISAQPPGKKLQNLQLLSGGERSLTAVALLFAMLRVRPVPFCIMDEVDAALDEGNIARFGEMVRTFAEKTQFIIITHNRGTMEVANQLYGVTMTEPGVSRILSLRLEDAARQDEVAPNGHHPVGATVGAA